MAELRYTNRDYAAIREGMVADAQFKTPEWTNFNQGELGVALIELVSSALDVLSFALDGLANETFLPTAVTLPSVIALLRNIGYEMTRRIASTATVEFILNTPSPTPIIIPAGTIVGNDQGVEFVVKEEVIIEAGVLNVAVIVFEGTFHAEGPFTSNGQNDQLLRLGFKDVAENFLDVFVDGVKWTEEKFAELQPTQNPEVYRVTENVDGSAEVLFSTALGDVPAAGELIEFRYVSTNGASGNIGALVIDTIITEIPVPLTVAITVEQDEQSGGGLERESIKDAKVNGPRALRTNNRVVTLQDFIDFVSIQDGVESASALNHSGFVEMYVRLFRDIGTGLFPVFKVEAPIMIPLVDQTTGGTVPATTEVFVAVTSKDANGKETNVRLLNPTTGVALANSLSITTSGGPGTHAIDVQINAVQPPNTTVFNVYAGFSLSTMFLVANDVVPADILDTVGVTTVTAIPVSGTALPTENLAGGQNALTERSFYQDIFDAIVPLKQVSADFDLFEPTAIVIAVTIDVAVKDNFRRTEVSQAVDTFIDSFFNGKGLDDDFLISELETFLFNSVAGIQNIGVTLPAADVTILASEYMEKGVVTINATGGIS